MADAEMATDGGRTQCSQDAVCNPKATQLAAVPLSDLQKRMLCDLLWIERLDFKELDFAKGTRSQDKSQKTPGCENKTCQCPFSRSSHFQLRVVDS